MFGFLLASLVLVVMPGPDQALITRNAIARGRRAGLATMIGGASGIGFHATAATVGLSALLAASATAFTMLKLVGTAYLLYLAAQAWRHAKLRSANVDLERSKGTSPFRQGLLSNSLNPKVAVFFLTFLPQFLPDHADPLTRLGFAGLFAVTYLCWFTFYVVLVDSLARWLRRGRVRAAIDRVSGGLLFGFAARLALASR